MEADSNISGKDSVKNDAPLRLAVVGFSASGKDTAADYLVSRYGFEHISSSDIIRSYISEHGLGRATREVMQSVGRKLRADNGPDYLVVVALSRGGQRLVVSGLRAVEEAIRFKEAGGKIIAVEAPIDARYKRVVERGDIDSKMPFEKFKEFEEAETSSTDPTGQNLAEVISLADYKIESGTTVEKLYAEIDRVLSEISRLI